MKIQLEREDIEECRRLAKMRNTKKEGVQSTNNNPHTTDFQIHFYGVIGEYAFSKITGYPMDYSHNPDGGDPGYDFEINGYKIDIKYSKHGKYLGFSRKDKFKADIAVLVKPVNPKIPFMELKIVGWCTREDFMEKSEPIDLGFSRIVGIPTRNLRNYNTLQRIIGGK